MRMLALRNNPISNMYDFRNHLESVFNEMFAGDTALTNETENKLTKITSFRPSVDAYEEENKYVIKAALPGIEKDDISINLEEKRITISGERKHCEEVKEENMYRSEIIYGNFERSFSLAEEINIEEVKAEFNNGLLKIELPKKEEVKAKTKTLKL
ncbi:MAG: Hsp20/alpha crystallin family protein [Vampirovibrionia bacterium]